MTVDFVGPYNGDPQLGHLSTPISDSPLVRAYISNLPAYRAGLSPLLRGLEIGMAHGYFLVGPEVVFGPLRDYAPAANLGGLVTAIAIVLLGTICLAAYGIVSFQNGRRDENATLKSSEDGVNLRGASSWVVLAVLL
jgi:Photosystem I reaction centre subunit XI.